MAHLSSLAQRLLMTDALPVCDSLYALTLSGGVGECFRAGENDNPFRFGDIGLLLAQAIHNDPGFAALPVQANQTVRATVIGAGAHTLSLSGSTIWLDGLSLPIRNIPVVHPAGGNVALLVDECCKRADSKWIYSHSKISMYWYYPLNCP